MFKNVQNSDVQIQGNTEKESFVEIITALGEIGSTTKKILDILQKGQAVSNSILNLLPSGSKPYRTDGYTFSSIFVSDAQVTDSTKLIVKVDGVQYTKTLAAGENIVNIPDGAELSISNTSNTSQGFLLSRYNKDRI
jgi:hypothetical protein